MEVNVYHWAVQWYIREFAMSTTHQPPLIRLRTTTEILTPAVPLAVRHLALPRLARRCNLEPSRRFRLETAHSLQSAEIARA